MLGSVNGPNDRTFQVGGGFFDHHGGAESGHNPDTAAFITAATTTVTVRQFNVRSVDGVAEVMQSILQPLFNKGA